MIQIRPLLQSELPALKTASEADGHGLFFQSHLITRDAEIVGSFSQCVPVNTVWLHSQKLTPAESFQAIRRLDEHLVMSGLARSLTLCTPESPFFPYMVRLGKKEILKCSLFERTA